MFTLGLRTNDTQTRKVNLMPGTRVAPDVTGAPSSALLSMSMVDADDGQTTVSFLTNPAATNAAVEALAANLQAISQASLFEVRRHQVWAGIPLSSNAVADDYVSVNDVIRLSNKQISSGAYIRAYAPSPLGDIVGPNGTVVTTNAAYIAWRDAVVAVLPAGFALLNVGFVQNVQRNKGISPIA
jgi:hypothetical protein